VRLKHHFHFDLEDGYSDCIGEVVEGDEAKTSF